MPLNRMFSKPGAGKVSPAIAAVFVGIVSLTVPAAPARAAGTSSFCAAGIGCGSARVYSVNAARTTFRYDLSIRDTDCSAASGGAFVNLRVWWTSGVSTYSANAVRDNNCADGRAATLTNSFFINEGHAVPGTLVYFRVVVYDVEHINGVLGPRVNI
ncbi:hypothetical protein [Jidongwangia harbinensis]|uniref:hypothetical protein n=1 Tax=Jidongwangia harbinensis TaxID=2878561 RepID=UPI001CDA4F59|nr:hypothetical protein [Jidongwangia harbinensis]MCA2214111.1 hypothetical protein [Jidongwangia harbinensis]